MPVCVLPDLAATVDGPSELGPASWANVVAAEVEEHAGLAAVSVDLSPELCYQDLVNTIRITHPEQINLVAAGIVQTYQTHHSFVLVWAELQLLFDARCDIGNVLPNASCTSS